MKLIKLLFLYIIIFNTAQANYLVHKAAYNPKTLSVEKSSSWKFTVSYSTGNSFCTGFFITRYKMITAAHCFDDGKKITEVHFYKGSELYVYASEDLAANIRIHSSLDVAVVDFQASPIYTASFDDFRAVETVSSNHLKRFSDLRNRKIYITGAGKNNRGQSYYLGFVKGKYNGYYRDEIEVKHNRQGICFGDSGSPVLISDPNDGLVAIGINVSISSPQHLYNGNCSNTSYFVPLSGNLSDWIWR